ncbi:DUF1232 domain-containing protein [Variovorax sp. J22R133]|uniref:YkvA family protein n=1 Tax=Variovorax brevis TaxID=3053503 RepID=UPI0025790010|nr:DUF1232 domain-containing protein [Variovorax sp. J22R133]MDM0112662.1 DUF1232 domain-containing protein [Variovorax sp. J22R133]
MWKFGKLWLAMRKELALAWAMLRDARTPVASKLAIVAAGLYLLSPVDFVSDFIPVLGWIDDGLMVMLFLRLAAHLMPAELHEALKAQIAQRRSGAAR